MSTAAAKVKDPGAAIARIWEAAEIEPEKPPKDMPDERSISCDSSRHLVRRNPYPDAGRVTSCLSLVSIEGRDRTIIRDLIMGAAYACPGDFVFGAKELPRYKAECMTFYQVAGFSPECADILTYNLRVNPLDS